jgi:hypothetical protein
MPKRLNVTHADQLLRFTLYAMRFESAVARGAAVGESFARAGGGMNKV